MWVYCCGQSLSERKTVAFITIVLPLLHRWVHFARLVYVCRMKSPIPNRTVTCNSTEQTVPCLQCYESQSALSKPDFPCRPQHVVSSAAVLPSSSSVQSAAVTVVRVYGSRKPPWPTAHREELTFGTKKYSTTL